MTLFQGSREIPGVRPRLFLFLRLLRLRGLKFVQTDQEDCSNCPLTSQVARSFLRLAAQPFPQVLGANLHDSRAPERERDLPVSHSPYN